MKLLRDLLEDEIPPTHLAAARRLGLEDKPKTVADIKNVEKMLADINKNKQMELATYNNLQQLHELISKVMKDVEEDKVQVSGRPSPRGPSKRDEERARRYTAFKKGITAMALRGGEHKKIVSDLLMNEFARRRGSQQ
jgi:hypothetical protein